MATFFNAVSAVLVLLLLIGLGYGLGKIGWMEQREKKFFSKFIVNIAVPCNCINGLLNNLDREMLGSAAWMVLAAFLGIVTTLLLSIGVATLLRLPPNQRGVFAAMAGFSNTLFIGLPMSTELFGDVSIPFVMLYYLASTVLVQSVGILLIEWSGKGGGARRSVKSLVRDIFTKPPILAVLFCVLLLLLDLRLPSVVMSFSKYVSGCVAPLALIYCGFILYEIGLKNLRLERGLPLMLVMRFLISPLICVGLCYAFGISGLGRSVFVVESALPVVSQVVVLSGAYGADEHYAAMGSCISTLACFVTVPILMLLLG